MVGSVSSMGRNGVHDFILLRCSAIIITLYSFYLVGFFVFTSDINYLTWHSFFSHTFTKVFTMLALLSVLIHAWIGLWQVLTDYVKNIALRGVMQLTVVVTLFSYFFVGLFILWGA